MNHGLAHRYQASGRRAQARQPASPTLRMRDVLVHNCPSAGIPEWRIKAKGFAITHEQSLIKLAIPCHSVAHISSKYIHAVCRRTGRMSAAKARRCSAVWNAGWTFAVWLRPTPSRLGSTRQNSLSLASSRLASSRFCQCSCGCYHGPRHAPLGPCLARALGNAAWTRVEASQSENGWQFMTVQCA